MTTNLLKIVLLGYMASGKSTIGERLASALHIRFVDLDRYIAEQEQKSITEIFDLKGEVYFRKKELHYLEELLTSEESIVLALGGGTPTLFGAMDLIKQNSTSFYLNASIKSLLQRLKPKKNERPLLANISDEILEEYIAVHLFERNTYYFKADYTIQTDAKTEEVVVDELKTIVRSIFSEK